MNINNYVLPKTLDEAYDLLITSKSNHLIGGGAWLKLSLKSADNLISLNDLDLNHISKSKTMIEIGSMTTLREIETNDLIKSFGDGILSKAVGSIMGVGIRNIATIGGSIMGKFSFSDIFAVLLVLDTILVFHKQGEVKLEDFLKQPKFEKDILVKIKIPNKGSKGFFKKVATTPLDFAIINIAVLEDNSQIRISVGSTPYIALRCLEAENYINNLKTIKEENINECANLAMKELKFSKNIRATKEYREDLARVYITRGLKQVTNYES